MHRVFQLLIATVALLTAAPAALAQNSLVAPPPSEIRWITQEKATSDCIGDITDPLCAVETLIACWARAEPDLCRRVHDETPDPVPTPELKPYKAEYRVKRVRLLQATDVFAYLEIAGYREGFAEIVLLRRFKDSAAQPNIGWMTYSYYLKPVDDGWRVFGWNVNFPFGIPPSDIRTVSTDSSTSNCIGNPITPQCAADTAVACGVRWDERLCAQVHGDGFSLPPPRIEFASVEYSLYATHTIRPEDISSTLRLQKLTEVQRPGNVIMQFWYRMHLRDTSIIRKDDWYRFQCTTQPADGNWRAVECVLFGFEPNSMCAIGSTYLDMPEPCWHGLIHAQ